MGLVKAALGAASGVMGDQWKEYFYCSALPAEVLAVKGQKKVSGRSSNRHGAENIITDGSIVAVAEGQCALIVEQGKVVDLCAEAGEYTYNTGTQPSLLSEGLAKNIDEVFAEIGKRFSFGGQAATDQRIYYINTKELMGNKYGTPSPVPFRVVDQRAGIDIDVSIRCFGEYSYRIVNPILFYTNVCGNVENAYLRETLDSQLKTELLTALQPAFGRIAAKGIRYTQLINYTKDIRNELSEELSEDWGKKRGIEIVSFGVSSVKAEEEDERRIKEIQDSAIMSNPDMRAGRLATATADAMRTAAGNEAGMGGAFGFMGMGMAGQMGAGAMGAFGQGPAPQGNPLAPPAQQPPAPQQAAPPAPQSGWTCSCGHAGNAGKFCEECGKPQPKPASGGWTCSCGQTGNTGKFCTACGKPRPEAGWVCSCGAHNTGKFCSECGKPRPAAKCPNCGWTPDDPSNPPKFCPECGKPFGA